MKKLVAYFSCSGVTKSVAKKLAAAADADLYEITPVQPYSNNDLDWMNSRSRSSMEMQNLAFRPAIEGSVKDMAQYDVVFVGFPIWWYIAPTIINTFLEAYDFSGKTVIPFATSGSSGMGRTEQGLYPSCSEQTKWLPGKLITRSDKAVLTEWLSSLGL